MDLGRMDKANGSATDVAHLFLGARGGQSRPRS
jgi:hypothetical protein